MRVVVPEFIFRLDQGPLLLQERFDLHGSRIYHLLRAFDEFACVRTEPSQSKTASKSEKRPPTAFSPGDDSYQGSETAADPQNEEIRDIEFVPCSAIASLADRMSWTINSRVGSFAASSSFVSS